MRWEWVLLAVILAVAVSLRFGRWDLLEFKGDESIALQLALGFVNEGRLPTSGLMSSVGVANPPLFTYLLIPVVALSTNIAFITSFIAATGLGAVVVCWHVGRKYYSPFVGLAAAALFAVSPWAVIYSRKIWAQDFIPIFASVTLWAVHALILGGNRRAIFWVVLLPLCVIQIHFSGFAFTAGVCCILFLLRPKFDWRYALGGAVAAFIIFTPYLYYQANTNWADFTQAAHTLGGNPKFNPDGLLIHPLSGYPLANHHYLTHALGIVNGGEIEDIIGLSKPAFYESLTFEDWALRLEQFAVVAGLLWLAWIAAHSLRWSKTFPWAGVQGVNESKTACILVCWVTVPVLIYFGVHLGTLISYFVLFYPAPYLLCAVLLQKLWSKAAFMPALLCGALAFILAGNLFFMVNLYGFIARNCGAYGSYGTVLGYKEEAARYLAQNADVRELMSQRRLVEMDHFGFAEAPQPDIPLLAVLDEIVPAFSDITSRTTVVVVDRNRATFTPEQWAKLGELPSREFGPLRLYIVNKEK